MKIDIAVAIADQLLTENVTRESTLHGTLNQQRAQAIQALIDHARRKPPRRKKGK